MKSRLVWIQNWITIGLIRLLFLNRKASTIEWVRLGSRYGGWWLPRELANRADPLLVVSAGIGFDVTFDREMLNRGHRVVCLDPIPECHLFAQAELGNFEKFSLIKAGIGASTGVLEFAGPTLEHHTSWGVPTSRTPKESMTSFPVISLGDLAKQIGLESSCGWLLKLDIEGFESAVLPSVSKLSIKPRSILVEMDFLNKIPFFALIERLKGIRQAISILKELQVSGFHLVKTEDFNFCFLEDIESLQN